MRTPAHKLIKNQVVTYIKENASSRCPITAERLREHFLCSLATLMKAITECREEGILIVPTNRGYYYGVDQYDFNRIVNDYRSRISAHAKTIKAMFGKYPDYKKGFDPLQETLGL